MTAGRLIGHLDREFQFIAFTEELDGGPRILAGRLRIVPGETAEELQHRVQAIEHQIYPEAAGLVGAGRVRFEDGQAVIDGQVAAEPIVQTFGDYQD